MTTGRSSLEHHTSASGHPDQAARHPPRASKLFGQDHAYAARLVQIATAIRSVMRSTMTMNVPDQAPSEIRGDEGITAGIVARSRARGRGGP